MARPSATGCQGRPTAAWGAAELAADAEHVRRALTLSARRLGSFFSAKAMFSYTVMCG
jgi:hypothetical protein